MKKNRFSESAYPLPPPLKIGIEHSDEKISILRRKHFMNERYTCAKLAHTCFWQLVTEVKSLGCLPIENPKKTASTQLLIYMRFNVAGLVY